MVFRLSDDAKKYFSKLDERVADTKLDLIMFDKYYACLMLGLKRYSIAPTPDSIGKLGEPFLANDAGYPGPYKGIGDMVAGLLIEAELKRKKIGYKDREEIETQTTSLLEPHSPVRLSEQGIKLLNRYAAKGFEIIREESLGAPRSILEFLMSYKALMAKNEG